MRAGVEAAGVLSEVYQVSNRIELLTSSLNLRRDSAC